MTTFGEYIKFWVGGIRGLGLKTVASFIGFKILDKLNLGMGDPRGLNQEENVCDSESPKH